MIQQMPRQKFYFKRLILLAPRAGFEPATIRLTVECSTAELPRNKRNNRSRGQRITKPPGLAKDQIAGFSMRVTARQKPLCRSDLYGFSATTKPASHCRVSRFD